MALEDFLEPEVAATAVVTAVIFSPRARKVVRRGAVYGLAGVLIAGDAIASLARNVGQGIQQAAASAQSGAEQTKAETEAPPETPRTNTAQKKTTSKATAETVGG